MCSAKVKLLPEIAYILEMLLVWNFESVYFHSIQSVSVIDSKILDNVGHLHVKSF